MLELASAERSVKFIHQGYPLSGSSCFLNLPLIFRVRGTLGLRSYEPLGLERGGFRKGRPSLQRGLACVLWDRPGLSRPVCSGGLAEITLPLCTSGLKN